MPSASIKTTPTFIFAIVEYTEEEIEFTGTKYNVYVSTKAYYDTHGHIQSSYSAIEYYELMRVTQKHGLHESMESCFECEAHSATDIKKLLENEPSFAYDQKFQDFIDIQLSPL